jgi:protein-tyrosine-phosphatase
MAEGLLKKALAARGIGKVSVSSCGTDTLPKFKVPAVVLRLMAVRGIDLSGHMTTPIGRKLLRAADLILVMENYHLRLIETLFAQEKGKAYLFKTYVGEDGDPEIPDPMGKTDEAYAAAADSLERCVGLLVEELAGEQRPATAELPDK